MVTELIMDGGWSLKDLCNLEATTQSLYSFWTSEHLNFGHFRSKQAAAWAKISHGQLAPADDNDTDDRQLENLEDQLNGLLDDLKDSPDYEQLKDRIQFPSGLSELIL